MRGTLNRVACLFTAALIVILLCWWAVGSHVTSFVLGTKYESSWWFGFLSFPIEGMMALSQVYIGSSLLLMSPASYARLVWWASLAYVVGALILLLFSGSVLAVFFGILFAAFLRFLVSVWFMTAARN